MRTSRPALLTLLPALVLPALAQAHPGHAADAGFVTGALHPFTGLDHLIGLAAAGLLLRFLPHRLRWFTGAGFLALLGASHVLWVAPAAGPGYVAGLLGMSAGLVAAPMLLSGTATRLTHLIAAARRSRTWAAAGTPAKSPSAPR